MRRHTDEFAQKVASPFNNFVMSTGPMLTNEVSWEQ